MSTRDIYSEVVKNALIKDGWTITDDPLMLSYGNRDVYVDLGAEKVLGAEKDGQKIAIEIKSFVGKSDVKDLRDAIGQYIMYRDILYEKSSPRILYMAVTKATHKNVFEMAFGYLFLKRQKINLIVFDQNEEVIIQWIQQ